jgi:hypothetical protein
VPRSNRAAAATAEAPAEVTETGGVEIPPPPAPAAESTEAPAPSAGRQGRPRPQVTLERDRLVADKLGEYALDQEWTKDEVAQVVGLDANIVMHCLNRLTWSGNVEKIGRGKFKRTAGPDGQPTPYSNEYVNKPAKGGAAVAATAEA